MNRKEIIEKELALADADRIEELRAQVAGLRAQAANDEREIENLRALAEDRKRELEGAREELQGLRAELEARDVAIRAALAEIARRNAEDTERDELERLDGLAVSYAREIRKLEEHVEDLAGRLARTEESEAAALKRAADARHAHELQIRIDAEIMAEDLARIKYLEAQVAAGAAV